MKEVAEGIFKLGAKLEAVTTLEDRLGITMKFLRASEQGSLGEISRCLEWYPKLCDLVDNPYDI
eukprot:763250-Pyramimonas_sp.AAC.1